ncbi:membrane protein [Lentilactobacillus fungorum]|uniref:Membrane protein n=1 Tax=Lentilactobacillus fungorum TaxID=2201250 RepID=A0ABQ3VZJ7_9LACO|nr:TMEM175 family protein [Lentilactobacillus fungorum]GHP13636.1 membrane protein [Lentilactobacillus fungorum]
MDKSRVEAFTDAVLAIILTIMILEFKTPVSFSIWAIDNQLPYLISYAIGYLFIGTAWYNHHYMFAKTHRITKAVYWANNFWMFTTSFLPVATSWVGRGFNEQGPEIFYGIVYFLWSLAYLLLSKTLILANISDRHEKAANSIRQMRIYRFMSNWKLVLIQVILVVLGLIYVPATQMLIVTLEIVFVGARFNKDSDRLFNS